jgi:addiction module RelE/StbE family toxin
MERSIWLTTPCKEIWRKLHIDIQKSMKSAIKKLERGELQGKELTKELQGYNSLLVSNYRVIYQIIENRILIVHVGRRKNVYTQTTGVLNSPKTDEIEPI